MAEYNYTDGAMDGAIEFARSAVTNITNVLHQLDGELRNGMLSHWTGPARDDYETAQVHWFGTAESMPQTLTVAHQTLENILERYRAAERAGTVS